MLEKRLYRPKACHVRVSQRFRVSVGVLVALLVVLFIVYWFIRDITQKRHTVLRNFPVIGHLRFFFENLGEYFRQYLFLNDREEMPYNRATRAWVYRLAKNEAGILGFGSTYELSQPGALVFVNAAFPVLDNEFVPTPPLIIGEGWCDTPFAARSVINISGMSYGAISQPAVRALSRGAGQAGCYMDTGEGGLSPYHLEGGCDLIYQIGTAKYGCATPVAGSIRKSCAKWPRRKTFGLLKSSFHRAPNPARAASCRQQGDRGNRPHPRHSVWQGFAVTQSPSGNRQHGRIA